MASQKSSPNNGAKTAVVLAVVVAVVLGTGLLPAVLLLYWPVQ